MKRLLLISFLLILVSAPEVFGLTIGHPGKELKTLPSVYIDEGACPFECCTYREWTAKKMIQLFDQPHGRKIAGVIQKGERVEGVTGRVEVIPRKVTVTYAHRDEGNGSQFEKNEVFYVLTYLGEGFFQAWADGQLFEVNGFGVNGLLTNSSAPNCSPPSENCWATVEGKGQSEWWVKIKTKSGVEGWTHEGDQFDGQDSCG